MLVPGVGSLVRNVYRYSFVVRAFERTYIVTSVMSLLFPCFLPHVLGSSLLVLAVT